MLASMSGIPVSPFFQRSASPTASLVFDAQPVTFAMAADGTELRGLLLRCAADDMDSGMVEMTCAVFASLAAHPAPHY